MADFWIKRADLKPSITSTLTDGIGAPVDLNGAEVRFLMREIDGELLIEKDADIVDPDAGTVVYHWQEGDTDQAGGYEAEWRVTFADDTSGTFPNDRYNLVAILDDLEPEGS